MMLLSWLYPTQLYSSEKYGHSPNRSSSIYLGAAYVMLVIDDGNLTQDGKIKLSAGPLKK